MFSHAGGHGRCWEQMCSVPETTGHSGNIGFHVPEGPGDAGNICFRVPEALEDAGNTCLHVPERHENQDSHVFLRVGEAQGGPRRPTHTCFYVFSLRVAEAQGLSRRQIQTCVYVF